MEEIKVNDYIRTSKGQIDIFKEYGYERTCVRCENKKYFTSDITKHSPNIIDLIEVGDYVNGCRVGVDWIKTELIINQDDEGWKNLKDIEIKNIVTKEQFNSIKYRLE